MNIHFTIMNFFLKYSLIHFLKQKINILKLITVENKLVTIINLKFFKILT